MIKKVAGLLQNNSKRLSINNKIKQNNKDLLYVLILETRVQFTQVTVTSP